jgi:hypothetical protein
VRDLRKRESQLEQRVKTVSARERELAKRAGQLASRERDLGRRASELDVREDEFATRVVDRPAAQKGEELAAQERELESHPSPEPLISEPVLTSQPATSPPVTPGGVWNIHDLEHAVEADADAAPEQVEEWRTYLYFLRQHASADGALPPGFSSLISDVFAELFVERSSSAP